MTENFKWCNKPWEIYDFKLLIQVASVELEEGELPFYIIILKFFFRNKKFLLKKIGNTCSLVLDGTSYISSGTSFMGSESSISVTMKSIINLQTPPKKKNLCSSINIKI